MDWKRTLWKGVKTAAVSAASIAAAAFVSSFLNQVDTADELTQLGLPVVWVPLVLAAVSAARNYLKNHRTPPGSVGLKVTLLTAEQRRALFQAISEQMAAEIAKLSTAAAAPPSTPPSDPPKA